MYDLRPLGAKIGRSSHPPWRIDAVGSGEIENDAVAAGIEQLRLTPQPALVLRPACEPKSGCAKLGDRFVQILALEIDGRPPAAFLALVKRKSAVPIGADETRIPGTRIDNGAKTEDAVEMLARIEVRHRNGHLIEAHDPYPLLRAHPHWLCLAALQCQLLHGMRSFNTSLLRRGASFNDPRPEARRPKAGASKDMRQRCSCLHRLAAHPPRPSRPLRGT